VADKDGRARTYAPVYCLASAMGVESDNIFFDISKSTMIVIKESNSIAVTIGSSVYKVNGTARIMDVAPLLINGQIMLPPRWIAQALGGQVGWNPTTQQILVLY